MSAIVSDPVAIANGIAACPNAAPQAYLRSANAKATRTRINRTRGQLCRRPRRDCEPTGRLGGPATATARPQRNSPPTMLIKYKSFMTLSMRANDGRVKRRLRPPPDARPSYHGERLVCRRHRCRVARSSSLKCPNRYQHRQAQAEHDRDNDRRDEPGFVHVSTGDQEEFALTKSRLCWS